MADSKKPWLSGGKGTSKDFSKEVHDTARAMEGKWADLTKMARERREYRAPKESGEREKLMTIVRQHRVALQSIDEHSRGMSVVRVVDEKTGHHHAIEQAERKLATMPKAVQEGERGGRYYISATGQKVYVKSNPGAEVVGHMTRQRFHQGLPVSVHLAEPKRR